MVALFGDERMEVSEAKHLKGLTASSVAAPEGTSAGKLAVMREVVSEYNAAAALPADGELADASASAWGPPAAAAEAVPVVQAVKLEASGFGKELAAALEKTLLKKEDKKKEWEKVWFIPPLVACALVACFYQIDMEKRMNDSGLCDLFPLSAWPHVPAVRWAYAQLRRA